MDAMPSYHSEASHNVRSPKWKMKREATMTLRAIHGLFLNKGASFEKLTRHLESMLMIVQFLLVSPVYGPFLCHLQLLWWGFGCHLWTNNFSWVSAFMMRDADSSVNIQVWTICASTDAIMCLVSFSSSFFCGQWVAKGLPYNIEVWTLKYQQLFSATIIQKTSEHAAKKKKKKNHKRAAANVVWSHGCHVPIIPLQENVLRDFWLDNCHEIMSPAGVNFIGVLVTDFLKM